MSQFNKRSSTVAALCCISACVVLLLLVSPRFDFFSTNVKNCSPESAGKRAITLKQDLRIVESSVKSKSHIETHMVDTKQYCFVTAYLNIERSSWNKFTRSAEEYQTRFARLVAFPAPLVIYIDTRDFDVVIDIVKQKRPFGLYTEIIPINSTFMETNIYAWSLLKRETEIMASNDYKALIPKRLIYPEHNFPKYTLVNHAKIDFIMYTAEILHKNAPYKYYGWADFGYFHDESFVPTGPFRLNALDLDKVTYMTINDLEPKDGDMIYTLQNAPEKVAGAFFFGRRDVLKEYQHAYHKALSDYQSKGIADDDQAVVAYIHYNLFNKLAFHKAGFKGAFRFICDGVVPAKV